MLNQQLSKHTKNNFTPLRLLSAWLILFGHSFDIMGKGNSARDSILFCAMSCFFIISGYLITASWEKTKNIPIFWKKIFSYMANRILRIAPALIVITIISVFIWGVLLTNLSLHDYFHNKETWAFFRNAAIWNMSYDLPGVFTNQPSVTFDGPLWSIPLEFRLYITIAILGLLSLTRPKMIAAIVITLIITGIVIGIVYMGIPHPKRIFFLKYFVIWHLTWLGTFFFLGSFAFLIREKIKFNYYWLILSFAVGGGIFLIMPYAPYLEYIAYIPYAYIILYLALKAPVLNNSFIQNNDVSYGFYLYAYPIQQTYVYLIGDKLGFGLFVVICTIISYGAGYISWKYIEKPMLKLKPNK